MWLLLAFLSATLLGFYDAFKKQSLKNNAVLPVLFLNTIFSSLIFLPFILLSRYMPECLEVFYVYQPCDILYLFLCRHMGNILPTRAVSH